LNDTDDRAIDVAVRRMQDKTQLILDDYWKSRGIK
jgi:hypothetical protein